MKDGFRGERAIVIPKLILDMIENDPLAALLHVTDIGYYPAAAYHYRERLEPIDQHVLIYCVDGEGFYTVRNHEYHVQANQFFVLPKGEPHRYGTGHLKPWTIYWLHFRGSVADAYLSETLAPSDVTPGITSRIGDRIRIFEEMFSTLEAGYSIDNLRYVSSLLHAFLGSLRFLKQFRNAVTHEAEQKDMTGAVIYYMKENVEKHLSLNDLAGYSGYSPSRFSAIFKQKTGHSPLTYFNLLKIQKACHMLDHSDMKVTQISGKLGITDTYYFIRLFTKIMGMSPSRYRKTSKG